MQIIMIIPGGRCCELIATVYENGRSR